MPITLVLEDGTGVANANSFVDVAFADAYHLTRFNDQWSGTDEAKKSALVVAADYMKSRFNYRGIKTHLDTGQSLPFPRRGICDADGQEYDRFAVPDPVQEAQAELALVAICSGGSIEPAILGPDILRRRERVGSIETDTEYLTTETAKLFPRAMAKLAPFISTEILGRGAAPIERA